MHINIALTRLNKKLSLIDITLITQMKLFFKFKTIENYKIYWA